MALTAHPVLPGQRSAGDFDAAERLRRHLVEGHHRTHHELPQSMLGDIHRLEHVDSELGLLRLDHHHPI